VEQARFS
jgi:hypothetical protein